jgi:glycosyltransferase involved in cell wall biosynthesis
MNSCKKRATSNVQLLGYQSDQKLREIMGHARAFVFAAEEDFGISPVEAQACGTPVICYGKGGVLDSVVDRSTGIYFTEQSAESIADAIRRFEALKTPLSQFEIRAQAQRFSPQQFRKRFQHFVAARWKEHEARLYGSALEAQDALAIGA